MPEQENTQIKPEKEVKLVPILGTSIEPDDNDIEEREEEKLDEKEEGLQNQEVEIEEVEEKKEDETPREESGESKDVSFADFLAAKAEGKGEEVPPKLDAKPKAEDTKKPASRDYSGIDEEHVPLFKGMSNDSFAALKPVYQEHRELKKSLAEREQQLEVLKKASNGQEVIHPSFHAHPKAFMLTREYGQRLANSQLAQGILDHWNTQIIKIRRGEDWNDLQEDPKTGQLFISSEAKTATADDELAVMRRVSEAQQQAVEWKTKVAAYATEHTNKYQEDINVVRETEQHFFPGYDKPEHPTRKIQDAVINALPDSLREAPLARTLSYVSANNVLLQAEVQKLKKELSTLQSGGGGTVTKQPTRREFGTSGKPSRTVTFQDFINRRDD